MNEDNLIHGRTCVYNVNYHIVWSVKYRRKVLTAEVEAYLKSVIQDIAQEKGFEIAECEVGEKDHVHVFVSAHPKIAPSYIAKMLKGISGRKLFLKYPEITKKLGRVTYGIQAIIWKRLAQFLKKQLRLILSARRKEVIQNEAGQIVRD